jgi:hypothetical protein
MLAEFSRFSNFILGHTYICVVDWDFSPSSSTHKERSDGLHLFANLILKQLFDASWERMKHVLMVMEKECSGIRFNENPHLERTNVASCCRNKHQTTLKKIKSWYHQEHVQLNK